MNETNIHIIFVKDNIINENAVNKNKDKNEN